MTTGPSRRGQGRAGKRRAKHDARVVWPPEQRLSARDAIEQLMRERGLARRFEGAVERAARKAAGAGRVEAAAKTGRVEKAAQAGRVAAAVETAGGFGTDMRAGAGAPSPAGPERQDLRDLATFTIDPAAARDFDDALSAEWIEDRRAVRVWVHIADVAAYVREGSPIDVEARLRGTSVYAPGAVEPMLPAALCDDACSLVPGRDRLAVSVELEVALEGARAGRRPPARFHRSLIRSDARLDYDGVDRIFAGRERAGEPWAQSLDAARAAARVLREVREARASALTLDSEEPEFELDDDGEVRLIVARVATESHRLIEHLMIAANEAVAEHLAERRMPCLYRVHERPEVAGVLRLVDQLASLGVPTPPVPAQLSRSQAAALLGECSHAVERHVRRTVARARAGERTVSPTGGRRALTTLVLRALQSAHYTPANLGHAGLASTCYCHFTSPIRRYPDLVCHRALLATLGHPERAPGVDGLAELGDWCSGRERSAMEIERDADDIARCFALERALYDGDPAAPFVGEVIGLISAGAFIAFGGPPTGGGAGGVPVGGGVGGPPVGGRAGGPPAGSGGAGGAQGGSDRDGRVDRGAREQLAQDGSGGSSNGAAEDGGGGAYQYQGFLPVRRLAETLAAGQGQGGAVAGEGAGGVGGSGPPPRARAQARDGAVPGSVGRGGGGIREGGRAGRGGRTGRDDGRDIGGRREWWELNDQGTILHGERSGATLRLGDPIAVRVARVDAPRGRVRPSADRARRIPLGRACLAR